MRALLEIELKKRPWDDEDEDDWDDEEWDDEDWDEDEDE
jgi:hypothetical protein